MIDDCVGLVLAALEKKNFRNRTVIVFTSDHGEYLGDHGLLRKGPPPYRQLLEVTMLLCGPSVPAGRTIDELTSHLDLMPTLLELAGVKGPAMDGRSLTPLWQDGKAAWRDAIFAEYHPRSMPPVYNHTIITKDWRYTAYPARVGWRELFDRREDPHERCNRATDPLWSRTAADLEGLLAERFPARPRIAAEQIARW